MLYFFYFILFISNKLVQPARETDKSFNGSSFQKQTAVDPDPLSPHLNPNSDFINFNILTASHQVFYNHLVIG
jgi:hypothetical protein